MWQAILNSLKSFLGKFLKSAAQKQLQLLMPIASNVVSQVESDPSLLINGDKRSTAVALIGTQLIDSQKSIAPYLINLAIELAVCELKQLSGN
jgi:hypothetical protein